MWTGTQQSASIAEGLGDHMIWGYIAPDATKVLEFPV